MKLRTLAASLGLALMVNTATVFLDSNVAEAKKEEQSAEPVLEKTLSGRTNPATKIGAKGIKALQKAGKFSEEEKYAEAIAEVDKVLAMSKATPYETAKANQMKSSFLYYQDDLENAVLAAQAAIKANGLNNIEHLQTMLMVVQLQYQLEQYDAAIASFNAYAAEAPTISGKDYMVQASNFYNQDKYQEAIGWTDKAFATGDKPESSWFQIKANSYYQSEDYEGGITYLKSLLEKDPNNKQWINLLVSSYLSLDKFDDALQVLDGAKKIGAMDSPDMWRQLYQLYQNADRYEDAAKAIEEGIAAGQLKRDAKTMNDMGQNLYTAAQDLEGKPGAGPLLDRAEAVFKEAVGLDPADGSADVWLGQLYMFERENDKSARTHLAAAVTKKVAQIGNAWYLLGVAEYNLKNNAAARTALVKAQGFAESKTNATNFLKNLK